MPVSSVSAGAARGQGQARSSRNVIWRLAAARVLININRGLRTHGRALRADRVFRRRIR